MVDYIDLNYNEGECGIIASKQLEAMDAIKKYIEDNNFKNENLFMWTSNRCIFKAMDIVSLMEELRFEVDKQINEDDEEVYSITYFFGEKQGDEDIIFSVLAPYMSNGYLEFSGGQGDMWRYNFVNGKLIETQGEIVFPEIDFTKKER